MIRKIHLKKLNQKLEQEVRRQIRDEGHPDEGCYIYIRSPDPKCASSTPPLTEDDRMQIRRMYRKKNATARELATLYGKTRQAIYQILREPDEKYK